jgi:uncharacterized protein YbjT (DUF2867 family)
MMYAITGITGKVGGTMARALLAAGQPVRAVVRDAKKGEAWAALGCEIALAEMEDTALLTKAFVGATAVFILPPSEFDPEPGYPEAQKVIDSVVAALTAARPKRCSASRRSAATLSKTICSPSARCWKGR